MFTRSVLLLASLLTMLDPPDAGSEPSAQEIASAREAIDATGFLGTVLVYDLNEDRYVAGHAERIDRRLIPASTFKIFNSLVALETGVISDPHAIIKWDGIVRRRTELNRDLDLQTAFQLSAVPHFQELARRIGLDRMQQFIDAVGYGNGDISGGIDQFWLAGGLRISPREQVDFLVRLYRDALPFSARTMAMVKEIMVSEQTPDHVIRSKTGWATLPQDENVGWWIGWVERESGVYMFATALEAKAPDETFVPARQGVTRKVLGQLGLLEPSP
jgi:beta-lactamase class D